MTTDSECPAGKRTVSFLAAVALGEQEQTVTWVWVEQIDSEPLSTLSRHTAFIIIRRQERFEASRGSSGRAEQAGRHVTEHYYSSCSKLWGEARKNVQAHWWRKHCSTRRLQTRPLETMLCRDHKCFLRLMCCCMWKLWLDVNIIIIVKQPASI